jgi:hypothetical protein
VISLADFERLQEACARELRSENQVALDWLDPWENAPDVVDLAWWEAFERDLCDHPVILGKFE